MLTLKEFDSLVDNPSKVMLVMNTVSDMSKLISNLTYINMNDINTLEKLSEYYIEQKLVHKLPEVELFGDALELHRNMININDFDFIVKKIDFETYGEPAVIIGF
jgi:adenylate cyclase class IV